MNTFRVRSILKYFTRFKRMESKEHKDGQLVFEKVLGMPTSLLRYGQVNKDTEMMFIVVPGNPGVIEFYDCFLEKLFTNLEKKVPVWGISHAGHVQPPSGNQRLYHKLSYEVCTLEGQIRHKVAFIKENIPSSVKLFFIGHSIGCYIILKVLDQLDHQVQRSFLLFPTIERMAVSPNGRVYTPALKYFRWLAPYFVSGFSFLPEKTKAWIIDRHFADQEVPSCIHSAAMCFLRPFSLSNALFMAHQEMQAVDRLDCYLIRKHLSSLSFYFGTTDSWCPLDYSTNIQAQFPESDIKVCDKGYMHAFVIEASPEMADIVTDWSQSFMPC